jgi:hypothetical protein
MDALVTENKHTPEIVLSHNLNHYRNHGLSEDALVGWG